MSHAAWLKCVRPNPGAHTQLLCLPHAGGGAHVFRTWADALPDCEVWAGTLPGHVGRMTEPLPTDLRVCARHLATAIAATLDRRVALFGHSMGAWLALEAARFLEAASPVAALIVAGRNGPGFPDVLPPLGALSDSEFLLEVGRRYGGISANVAESAEIMEVFLPVIRADIAMMERYDPTAGPRLTAPVLACAGSADPGVSADGLTAWSVVTIGQFDTSVVPGGHFFLQEEGSGILKQIAAWLEQTRAPRSGMPPALS